MSELNDMVRVYVGDADVVTVPLVDNLTASNAAPKASTVGAALAQKVDTDSVMEHVSITVDGIASDNQGVILINGDDIPIDDTQGADDIKTYVDAIGAKTAEDITYESGETATIKDVVDALAENIEDVADNLFASEIKMSSSDTTTVAAKISEIDGKTASDIPYGTSSNVGAALGSMAESIGSLQDGQTGTVKVSSQTFTDGEQSQARTNIGAAARAETVMINDAQTLNVTQQAQARANIAALGASDVADVVRTIAQTIEATAQAQARANIGAGDATTLAAHTEKLTGMFLIREYSTEVTNIAAGALQNVTAEDFGITDISGYTPVAVLKYNTGSRYLVPSCIIARTSGGVIAAMNSRSTEISTTTMTVSMLFVKTELIGL